MVIRNRGRADYSGDYDDGDGDDDGGGGNYDGDGDDNEGLLVMMIRRMEIGITRRRRGEMAF